MGLNLLAGLVLVAAAQTPAMLFECVDARGATYYRADGCKDGEKQTARVNATGLPIAPRVPQAPKAPQYPTATPAAKPG